MERGSSKKAVAGGRVVTAAIPGSTAKVPLAIYRTSNERCPPDIPGSPYRCFSAWLGGLLWTRHTLATTFAQATFKPLFPHGRHVGKVASKRSGVVTQFNHVQSPDALLDIAHEVLVHPEAIRKFGLTQVFLHAQLAKQLDQDQVFGAMKALSHAMSIQYGQTKCSC